MDDLVIVKVTTNGGITGYGESYNGRAPLAVAATVATTLNDLFTGLVATETTALWRRFEDRVLANHGTCAACVCAMSGLGVDVDENFIRAHPITEGPAWH